jgi:hypothetical protein
MSVSSLLAVVVGAAISLAHTSLSGAAPQTLYTRTGGPIAAFAQDGAQIAWFAPSVRPCNTVHVRSLTNGLQAVLPLQGAARNVTCSWDVGTTPVSLALAGTDVVWTLRERTPLPFDYVLGAGVAPRERRERRLQELAHTKSGSGLWLGGVSGDGTTLVYGATSVDYVDEAGCLAGTGPCTMAIAGGGVYRVAGSDPPKLLPGTDKTGAVAVAASSGAVAYVPAGAVGKQGRPLPVADLPVEIVDALSGTSIAHVRPQGVPLALALTPHHLATLERTPIGLRIAWYARDTGLAEGSVPVSAKTSPQLSATDQAIVFHVGTSIKTIDLATGSPRTLLQAASEPVGLSLEGRRLAWAENLKGSSRIRALYLGSS